MRQQATNERSDLINPPNVVSLHIEQFTVSLGDHHRLSDGERRERERWRDGERRWREEMERGERREMEREDEMERGERRWREEREDEMERGEGWRRREERDMLTWWPPGRHSLQMNLHFAADI